MSHPLLQQLSSGNPDDRLAACFAARLSGSNPELAEALSDALGDPVTSVGRAASDTFVEWAHECIDVEAPLEHALHSSNRQRRWCAAITAARIAPPTPQLLPALIEGLQSPDHDVRWASARLIVRIGRHHPEVLPIVIGLSRSNEQAIVRRMATYAMRELAAQRIEAAELLLEAIQDQDLHLRRSATLAIAALQQPTAHVSLSLLRLVHEDADAATRRLAALALSELGAKHPHLLPEDTTETLQQALQSDDPDLQRAIQRALDRLRQGRP